MQNNFGLLAIIVLIVVVLAVAYMYRDVAGCMGDCSYIVNGKKVTAEEYLKKGGSPSECLYGCYNEL